MEALISLIKPLESARSLIDNDDLPSPEFQNGQAALDNAIRTETENTVNTRKTDRIGDCSAVKGRTPLLFPSRFRQDCSQCCCIISQGRKTLRRHSVYVFKTVFEGLP